jgi:excisionase family DNA binding protein
MTLTQAAAHFGMSKRTLLYAAQSGHLRARKVGPLWLTTSAAVERWQAEGKHTPGPAKGTKRQERHARGGSDGA